MYQLAPHKLFLKKAEKFVKKNRNHKDKLDKALRLLTENPFNLSLKTHRVQHRLAGKAFSSWVIGDVRIIWDFTLDKPAKILLIDLGGHSGQDKVYR